MKMSHFKQRTTRKCHILNGESHENVTFYTENHMKMSHFKRRILNRESQENVTF